MKFYIRLAIVAVVVIFLLLLLQQLAEEKPAPPPPVASTPAPPPQPVAMTPVPTPWPTPYVVDQARGIVNGAAQRAGVSVTGYRNNDGWVTVTVRSNIRNALHDFLDEAMRAGMRDIDLKRNFRESVDRQGRQWFEDTYRMRF
jgi:hypothetical protein